MKRRDGTRVARWVGERVRQVAPAGLGYWRPAWELVEGPSRRFLDALARWEATGSERDRQAVKVAGGEVVAAWTEAARQWEAAGRPTRAERERAGVARV